MELTTVAIVSKVSGKLFHTKFNPDNVVETKGKWGYKYTHRGNKTIIYGRDYKDKLFKSKESLYHNIRWFVLYDSNLKTSYPNID